MLAYACSGRRAPPAAVEIEIEMQQPDASKKKPYEKPRVTSHKVFEASMACVKIPGSGACQWNMRFVRS